MSEQSVFCVVEWDTDPSQWYGTVRVYVYNLGSGLLIDPLISFQVRHDLVVENNYGLIWTRKGDTITGRFVEERKKIAPRDNQSFTLGIQKPGQPIPAPTSLLFKFVVNGEPADVPVPPPPPPPPPNNLRVTHCGPNSVVVAWDLSNPKNLVINYLVDVDEGVHGKFQSNTASCTITGLSPETKYSIRVAAVNIAHENSEYSKPVVATTTEPLPSHDWDMRRGPFTDYTSYPYPKLTEYGKETGLDGAFLGFGVVTTDPLDTVLKWGGYPKIDGIPADLAHGQWGKDDIAEFVQGGGKIAISFGGASNLPLEAHEHDPEKIALQYDQIIVNYVCERFDFDFEGGFLADKDALLRHVTAMTILLQKRKQLKISYTLPVDASPTLQGFNSDGICLLQLLAQAGIQPSLINGMLMEFGAGSPASMLDCCKIALNGMHKEIKDIFHWDEAHVWRRIGACPMFGVNNNGKIFTLEDMGGLKAFALEKKIGCVSGWDTTRDKNGEPVTHTKQKPYDFCKIIATYKPAKD